MRTIKWIITSDKMDKTVVITVESYKSHPKYKKRYKVTKKFKAHDEENKFKTGDFVLIGETKPTSKTKRWEVLDYTK